MIKSDNEVKLMRESAKILAEVLTVLESAVAPGVTSNELDRLAYELITKYKAKPSFLGYKPAGAGKPFPATICASNNEVVVHGVPDDKPLKEGDVFSVDCGVYLNGFHSDSALTVIVGGKSDNPNVKKLLEVTNQALLNAINEVREGSTTGDLGYVIEQTIKPTGFSIVSGLTGHGIGKNIHEEPTIFNQGKRGAGMKLRANMVIAIEPMVSLGSPHIYQTTEDGYATEDNSIAAHFEHTILVTEDGSEVLTKR
ncbi:MAG: type I methionyl aminopeptidase [Candidatus Harrisonbacteria bacterium CG10_big_fil_rev_8_21_14_0_10_38_8]|uniref:Methionine aminopeptidase n=1 Tax=Candidatus Harrisonbacteria bacterium CG10_big_fil_rev_8_21_14_0_10_38_8 TaxID=1974582 RepID=A0A2M6WKK7_9BACT|nr:MAG: type I methionyl aminopeptidase [Candidatus Harrisonbacteria bacterium CG10_big_fil_rev_8_21_14_0_10_38_8]